MEKKTILLTGAAGFIGFHTALALLQRGDRLIGCDNFNPYYDVALKKARATHLKQLGVEILNLDICTPDALSTLISTHRVTHLLHLAAQAGVRHSMEHPESYVHSNLNGFFHVLEALKRTPHVKLIYASSSSVYGMNPHIPFRETDPTDTPASFYGATKKCNEILAAAYHHLYQISCTGLRFFTVYGPWGRPDMAYYSFTRAILEGKPIPVYGEGKLQRDYTYIDDIVAGILASLDRSPPLEIYNLGNNHPASILTLVHHLEEALGKKALIDFQPMPLGDVPCTYADITKSQDHLGFHPTIPLREGIQRFTQWYRQYTSK